MNNKSSSLALAETPQENPQIIRQVTPQETYISEAKKTEDGQNPSLQAFLKALVQRYSQNLKTILTRDNFTQEEIQRGLEEGTLMQLTRSEMLSLLIESEAGVGLTGGGDCAGIADLLSSFALNLNQELVTLGVRNAGAGLTVKKENFKNQLIIIEQLLAEYWKGQSSTPLGSARINIFKKPEDEQNAKDNLAPFKFIYGTGGDDHLGMLAKIAKVFADKVVVGTFKSIDGDGCIDGKPAQMLGFNTAKADYQRAFWAIVQNGATHGQVHVVEFFGRHSGKLPFEATRRKPTNFAQLPQEEQRKITEFGETIMLLVPERPTSLQSIAKRTKTIRKEQGSCVIGVAEGFMPPELTKEISRLMSDKEMKTKWNKGELDTRGIPALIQDKDLAAILEDPKLAAQFAETIFNAKKDQFGNIANLSGIRHFIIAAIKKFNKGETDKVNELLENYEARGATPNTYDRTMGEKIGRKMAELVNEGITGGKGVIYFEGMDAMTEEPVVVPLIDVTNKNTLNNKELYTDEMLRENGVFWE